MKKSIMLVMGCLMLGGCGIKMVKKQEALGYLDQGKAAVDQARAQGCSQAVTDQLNNAYEKLDAVVHLFD